MTALINFYHNVLFRTTLISKSLILNFFLNNFSSSLSRSSSSSSCLTSLHLIYYPYQRIYRFSLYMTKPSKSVFHHLLYYRCYRNTLSNIFIFNFIMFTTHLKQHPHLWYTYFIFLSILNRPTFCLVQQRRSYCSPIKLSLQFERYICVA